MARLFQLLVVRVGSDLVSLLDQGDELWVLTDLGVFPQLLQEGLVIGVGEGGSLDCLLLSTFFNDLFLRIKQLLHVVAVTWIIPAHRQQLGDLG